MSQKNLLQNIYLFRDLTNDDFEKVNEICSLVSFGPGDDIFRQNEEAKALYVIKYGSVRIHLKSNEGENIEVAVLGTGSHLGEMPLLDGENRSATVTAIEKTDIVEIKYADIEKLLKSNPGIAVQFYRELAKFLCGRLRITTNDLSFAREQNLSHF